MPPLPSTYVARKTQRAQGVLSADCLEMDERLEMKKTSVPRAARTVVDNAVDTAADNAVDTAVDNGAPMHQAGAVVVSAVAAAAGPLVAGLMAPAPNHQAGGPSLSGPGTLHGAVVQMAASAPRKRQLVCAVVHLLSHLLVRNRLLNLRFRRFRLLQGAQAWDEMSPCGSRSPRSEL